MSADHTAVTVADVLREAIGLLSRPNAYVTDAYALDEQGKRISPARDDVAAACAIGGVEHAIYRLCTETHLGSSRRRVAREWDGIPSRPRSTNPALLLYWETMVLLNRLSRKRKYDYGYYSTIEQMSLAQPKNEVLTVFRNALEQAEREAGAA